MWRSRWAAGVLLAALGGARAESSLEAILTRVAEEAQVFRSNARNVVGLETLDHTGRKEPPRLRLRVGKAATEAPGLTSVERRITSEYGYASFQGNPEALHEFRKVVAVNGRPVLDRGKARQAMAMNMRSADDRERRRLLADFERHGTAGAAADFGLMLLLFHRRGQASFEFALERPAHLGADQTIVVSYRQKPSGEGLNVYQGRELARVPMQGEIWVRRQDLVPLRITMNAAADIDGRKSLHAAVVDYAMSARGVLLPSGIHYTETVDQVVMTRNRYRYSEFKFFTADAEIKFTPADEAEPRP
jgi:hypothetical protein